MAYRVLEMSLLSAKDLKRVNLISRMEVYAVVTLSGDPLTRQCTQPDRYGGRHPSWNTSFRFNVPPTAATATGCLHVLLRTERAMGDRDVGEVIVPLADILAGAAGDPGPRPPQLASYQVRKVHRWEPRGVLHVSYRLGPVVAPQAPKADEMAAAAAFFGYPVARPFYAPLPYAYLPAAVPHPQAAGSGHDDATMAAVHTPPPISSSAGAPVSTYSLPAAAYPQANAAGHAVLPPATNGKDGGGDGKSLDFGVGLGAGLVSGAISGIMAADMMSEVAAYNYGYRAGLADGGGAGSTVYKKTNSQVPHVLHNKVEPNRTKV
ncbi:unnamed protein product [Urochloa humidicola]